LDLGTDSDWSSLGEYMKSNFALRERTVQVPPATRNRDVEGRAEMRKTEGRNQGVQENVVCCCCYFSHSQPDLTELPYKKTQSTQT